MVFLDTHYSPHSLKLGQEVKNNPQCLNLQRPEPGGTRRWTEPSKRPPQLVQQNTEAWELQLVFRTVSPPTGPTLHVQRRDECASQM